MYGIYNIKDSEQCVAIFDTLKQVADYLTKSEANISKAVNQNRTVSKKYKICKIEEEL